jgi:hypothetical protein
VRFIPVVAVVGEGFVRAAARVRRLVSGVFSEPDFSGVGSSVDMDFSGVGRDAAEVFASCSIPNFSGVGCAAFRAEERVGRFGCALPTVVDCAGDGGEAASSVEGGDAEVTDMTAGVPAFTFGLPTVVDCAGDGG